MHSRVYDSKESSISSAFQSQKATMSSNLSKLFEFVSLIGQLKVFSRSFVEVASYHKLLESVIVDTTTVLIR